jgi:hypothetical protein
MVRALGLCLTFAEASMGSHLRAVPAPVIAARDWDGGLARFTDRVFTGSLPGSTKPPVASQIARTLSAEAAPASVVVLLDLGVGTPEAGLLKVLYLEPVSGS